MLAQRTQKRKNAPCCNQSRLGAVPRGNTSLRSRPTHHFVGALAGQPVIDWNGHHCKRRSNVVAHLREKTPTRCRRSLKIYVPKRQFVSTPAQSTLARHSRTRVHARCLLLRLPALPLPFSCSRGSLVPRPQVREPNPRTGERK